MLQAQEGRKTTWKITSLDIFTNVFFYTIFSAIGHGSRNDVSSTQDIAKIDQQHSLLVRKANKYTHLLSDFYLVSGLSLPFCPEKATDLKPLQTIMLVLISESTLASNGVKYIKILINTNATPRKFVTFTQ